MLGLEIASPFAFRTTQADKGPPAARVACCRFGQTLEFLGGGASASAGEHGLGKHQLEFLRLGSLRAPRKLGRLAQELDRLIGVADLQHVDCRALQGLGVVPFGDLLEV